MKNLLTTRREVIGGLGGILAAGSAPHITSAATRGLGLRNAMLSGKKLPYDAEVEYLASNGDVGSAAIVIPGIDIQRPYEVTGDWEITQVRRRFCRFVSLNGFANGGEVILRNRYDVNQREYVVYITSVCTYILSETPLRSKDVVTINETDRLVKVSVGATGVVGTFTADAIPYGICNLCLWKGAVTYTAENGCGKIYYVKVSCKGKTVIELKPVRKDGVGYFYDTVSGQLFGNTEAGATPFTIGPDKVSTEGGGISANA